MQYFSLRFISYNTKMSTTNKIDLNLNKINVPNCNFFSQFIIFNETNELGVLQKFFDHIMDVKPHIFVTYNGNIFLYKSKIN